MDERTARKKALIAIGAMHRAELLVARQSLQDAVRPEALKRSAMQHLAGTVSGVFGRTRAAVAGGTDLAGIVPLLGNGLSLLGGRSALLRLLLSSGALSAAASGIVAFLRRRKQPAARDATS
ncbi:MAG TPA: hypothetical protein VIM12_16095 [Noviherbaspirillum sp.]|jgi:hypothetical protein|uniref:hypothetical protein n=1 Tax=Noviherbaspirillum sp. TaxID=1926288 RepID=UPI002F94AFC7